jgi:hypothetical protein
VAVLAGWPVRGAVEGGGAGAGAGGDGADCLSGRGQHGVPGDCGVGAGPGLAQPQAVQPDSLFPATRRLLASDDLSQAVMLTRPCLYDKLLS